MVFQRFLRQSTPCATALHASVGGVKVSIVAFQAIDPGSIPGRRTIFFPSHVALFLLALYATVGCDLASSFKDI